MDRNKQENPPSLLDRLGISSNSMRYQAQERLIFLWRMMISMPYGPYTMSSLSISAHNSSRKDSVYFALGLLAGPVFVCRNIIARCLSCRQTCGKRVSLSVLANNICCLGKYSPSLLYVRPKSASYECAILEEAFVQASLQRRGCCRSFPEVGAKAYLCR